MLQTSQLGNYSVQKLVNMKGASIKSMLYINMIRETRHYFQNDRDMLDLDSKIMRCGLKVDVAVRNFFPFLFCFSSCPFLILQSLVELNILLLCLFLHSDGNKTNFRIKKV